MAFHSRNSEEFSAVGIQIVNPKERQRIFSTYRLPPKAFKRRQGCAKIINAPEKFIYIK